MKYKWIFFFIGIIILGVFYKTFNPYEESFFPKCQFYSITGYKCVGCGSQRAIHNLLNFNIYEAIKENLLLVVSIPYIAVGAYWDIREPKKIKAKKIHNFFFGYKAIIVVFFIIIFYWIFRNFAFYENLF